MAGGVSLKMSLQSMPGMLYPGRAKAAITDHTSQLIGQALAQARQTVAAGTPVRTGTAQSGWVVKRPTPLSGTLSNPVPYVPFLIHGTRYMHASAKLNDALEHAVEDIARRATQLGAQITNDLTKG